MQLSTRTVDSTAGETKPTLETWNIPEVNTRRYPVLLYCLFVLFVLDTNNASIGVCVTYPDFSRTPPTGYPGIYPHLERYHFINCIVVTMFMSQFHCLRARSRSYSPVFRSARHRCHGTTVRNRSTSDDVHATPFPAIPIVTLLRVSERSRRPGLQRVNRDL